MSKIIIKEQDYTLPAGITGVTDIPFIIGFTGVDFIEEAKPSDKAAAINGSYYYNNAQPIADPDNKTTGYKVDITMFDGSTFNKVSENIPYFILTSNTSGAEKIDAVGICHQGTPYNVPTLCTSVVEFETYFGTAPWTFTKSVKHPENFDDYSKGSLNKNMYEIGDYEKSYVYAKELLNAGLPVVYLAIENNNSLKPDLDQDTKFEIISNDSISYPEGYEDYCSKNHLYFKTDYKSSMDKKDISKLIDLVKSYTVDSVDLSYADKTTSSTSTFANITDEIKENNIVDFVEICVNDSNTYHPFHAEYYLSRTADSTDCSLIIKLCFDEHLESSTSSTISMIAYIKGTNSATSTDYDPDPELIYAALNNSAIMDLLKDKGGYNIKYITAGGYPCFGLTNTAIITKQLDIAKTRGDCVALLDHTNNTERSLNPSVGSSVFKAVQRNTLFDTDGTHAAMFTPWGVYSCGTVGAEIELPASFGYLMSLAKSLVTGSTYGAIAGVSRGIVPNLVSLNTRDTLTNTIADSYQGKTGKSINAITNINPYGLTIWGNRTLKNNISALSATSFLNLRNLVSDVKKTIYTSAVKLMFEHNNDVLWAKFRAEVSPTLDKMVNSYGIKSYSLVKQATRENGKLVASVILFPIYSVEEFEVTVIMTNEEVTVE